jgi:hypothetical protein
MYLNDGANIHFGLLYKLLYEIIFRLRSQSPCVEQNNFATAKKSSFNESISAIASIWAGAASVSFDNALHRSKRRDYSATSGGVD